MDIKILLNIARDDILHNLLCRWLDSQSAPGPHAVVLSTQCFCLFPVFLDPAAQYKSVPTPPRGDKVFAVKLFFFLFFDAPGPGIQKHFNRNVGLVL